MKSVSETYLLILSLALSFAKCLKFVRMYSKLGFLVRMLGVTIKELLPFIFFFLLYTLFFGVAYSILGVEINTAEPVEEHVPVPTTMQKLSDKPHYPGMERFVSYMLYAFLNSIGDLQIPNYDDWLIERSQGKITELQELCAILLVWGIWLV